MGIDGIPWNSMELHRLGTSGPSAYKITVCQAEFRRDFQVIFFPGKDEVTRLHLVAPSHALGGRRKPVTYNTGLRKRLCVGGVTDDAPIFQTEKLAHACVRVCVCASA